MKFELMLMKYNNVIYTTAFNLAVKKEKYDIIKLFLVNNKFDINVGDVFLSIIC
mgnify:CR=1 FL=1